MAAGIAYVVANNIIRHISRLPTDGKDSYVCGEEDWERGK